MSTVRLAIGLLVTAMTLLLGVLVLVGYMLTPETSSQFRWGVGGVLVVFGIFRGFMLYRQYKQSNAPDRRAEPPE